VTYLKNDSTKKYEINYQYIPQFKSTTHTFTINIEERLYNVEIFAYSGHLMELAINGLRRHYICTMNSQDEVLLHSDVLGDYSLILESRFKLAEKEEEETDGAYISPMPAKIQNLEVPDKSKVTKGTALIVIESMKLQKKLYAHKDGIVKFFVKAGDIVQGGAVLLTIE